MSEILLPTVVNQLADVLYDAELQKKAFFQKQRNRIIYIILTLITSFILSYLLIAILETTPFIRNQSFILIFLVGIVFMGYNFYMLYSQHINYHKTYEHNIITQFVQTLYPNANYNPEGELSLDKIHQANRYHGTSLYIKKSRDYILIPMQKVTLEFLEIDTLYNANSLQFEGLFINISPHRIYTFTGDAVNSVAFQDQLKKLNKFWGSHPQCHVSDTGDITIDILTKNTPFLEAPRRLKVYSQEYLLGLYQELQLIVELGKIVDNHLQNK